MAVKFKIEISDDALMVDVQGAPVEIMASLGAIFHKYPSIKALLKGAMDAQENFETNMKNANKN